VVLRATLQKITAFWNVMPLSTACTDKPKSNRLSSSQGERKGGVHTGGTFASSVFTRQSIAETRTFIITVIVTSGELKYEKSGNFQVCQS
jgi:hypothetical protein